VDGVTASCNMEMGLPCSLFRQCNYVFHIAKFNAEPTKHIFLCLISALSEQY